APHQLGSVVSEAVAGNGLAVMTNLRTIYKRNGKSFSGRNRHRRHSVEQRGADCAFQLRTSTGVYYLGFSVPAPCSGTLVLVLPVAGSVPSSPILCRPEVP